MNTDKMKKMVDSLKNFNVKDLQNIDARQIAEMLQQRLDIALNIFLILVTVLATNGIVANYRKRSQTMTWEIQQRQERLEAVKESQKIKGEYAEFLEHFPKSILTDQLINKLSEFAAYRQVQVLSFSPLKEKGDDYIAVTGVQLNITSANYKNIILFMKDIEDAPYSLRVDRWSAKMKEQKGNERVAETRKQTVEANMEISSIRLKNE